MKNKKKKKRINTNKLILVLTFILMLIVTSGIFLKSELFDLKKVNVTGEKELSEDEIINQIGLSENKNIFTYDIGSMEKKLSKNSYVEDIKIKIKLPNTINIELKEKSIAAILKDDEKYCYMSKDGKIIDKIKGIDDNTDKIIVDINYNYKDDNIKFENDEIEKRLLYLLDSLYEKNIDKEVRKISFRENEVINLTTRNNTKVIIPNEDNLDYNVSRISKILVDLQSKNKKNGTVDLTDINYALYSP